MAGNPFNQLQQGQRRVVVFGIGGGSRQVELRLGKAGNQRAKALVVSFQTGDVAGDAVVASVKGGQHFPLARRDLFQGGNKVFGKQMLHHLPDRPAGTEKRLGVVQSGEGVQQRRVAVVQTLQGAPLPRGGREGTAGGGAGRSIV